jgi:DNA (cytosine-5)-methyltransferase 1
MKSLNQKIDKSPILELFKDISFLDKKVKRQVDLINQCIKSGKTLSAALKTAGMSYDDLIYVNSYKPPLRDNRYYTLEDFTERPNDTPVVSFFSGAGGLDLGLEAAGFIHTLLIESNPLFCETLKSNKPKWDVCTGDISNTEKMIELVSSRIGSHGRFNGLFVGGPPCQPFSIAANQRFNKKGENFKRIGFAHEKNGNLLFEYIALIKHFKPRAFLIENVPGLIDVDGGEQLERAYRELESCGYVINQPLILKADAYYIPQQRIRLFVVGNRINREFKAPRPNNYSLSVGSVFDLPIDGVENHVTRKHSAESILRYMMLNYGNRDKLGRVDRLDPLLPSKTVIAGGSAGGGRSHLHPYIPRTLSVRESARIQTFPDNYVFKGPVARQFTQVGNAVPPVLGSQLGFSIFKSFFD